MVANMFFKLYMKCIKYISSHQYKYSILNKIFYFFHKRRVRNDLNFIFATENFMDVVLEFVYFFIYYNRQNGIYSGIYRENEISIAFIESEHTHSIKSFVYQQSIANKYCDISIDAVATDNRYLRDEYSITVRINGFSGKGTTFNIQYNYEDTTGEHDYIVSSDNIDTMYMVEKAVVDAIDEILNNIYTVKTKSMIERTERLDSRQTSPSN